jgi:hypothetical protein
MVTISREKNFPSVAHPGPAWVYLYTVTIPGLPYPFKGKGIGWARQIAKQHGKNLPIVETWQRTN